MLVEEDVQPRVRGVTHGGGAKAGEEALEAFLAEDGGGGGGEGGVGVEGGFVADFEHGDGHHDETGRGAGDGASGEVREVRELG